MKTLRKSLLLLLPAPLLAVDSVVTFNELHYNPAGADESGEWIELHNQMSINVDLSGWRLASGIDFTFPEGTTIPGLGYLLIAKDPSHPSLAGKNALGPYPNSLSNGGERINLYSRSDRLMDRVEYGDSGEWPIAPDGSGATLAKLEGQLLSGKSASWATSLQVGGTPGAINFPVDNQPIPHTFVANDATWSYFDSNSAPPSDWNTTAFNDASWDTGSQLFGNSTAGPPVLTVTDHLVERFRASDLALSNGQTVSTWTDTATGDGQSQNATAGGNPTYQTNVTPSGEPVVRFDGNDELRTSISPGISGTSGFVYIAVVRANAAPSSGTVTNGSGAYLWDRSLTGGGNPLISLKADNGRFGLQKRYDNGSGLGGPVSSSSISTSDFQIVAVRRNTSSNQFEMWVDGVLESTDSDSGASLNPDPINIGRHATNTSGGFNGEIAELLIYEDELTNAELEAVGSYLENRYGLDTAYPGTTINTETSATANTSYYRQEFNFNGNPANTSIRLDAQFSDGAVFYLNGVEIHRENLPAGTITHSTPALSDHPTPSSTGVLTLPSSALVNGTNVLSVSLHSASGDTTTAFGSTLEGTELPASLDDAQGLVFSEITAALDASFFVEIQNPTDSPINTDGYLLEISGTTPASIPLPVTTLNPGDFLVLDQVQLGQIPSDNDKLFLFSPGNASVTDAKRVTNRLRGLSSVYPDLWLFPSAPTSGAANTFSFEDSIVINELCYNSPISEPSPGTPPTSEVVTLIPLGSTWRYNESGADLGSNWASSAHPVGGSWQSGPGVIAYDTDLGIPIATQLNNPALQFPSIVTYYFESDFTLTSEEASSLDSLVLNHLIDDGAVIYLNGVEIDRVNMPVGAISASTFADAPGVANATYSGDYSVSVPPGTAVSGTNRISVEIHQVSLSSSDVVFNLQVGASLVTDPGTPAIPALPGEEQWIEIYNRGPATINLTGWNFGEGIDFTFPDNTMLASGQYLVIAKDPAALAAVHPGLAPLGPYDGSLSRNGETITLRDSFNNPADTLRYYDGGRWPAKADAAGSTLELTDPDADNSLPGAWSASNELSRTSWQTYTFRATASASTIGPDNQWKDFVLGMLEEGEVLIDDLTVTENPDGSAVPFITDGTFETGNLNSWRALGNHREASIIPDPSSPGNNVLYLRATGSTEHMHNHLETTLRNNESVINGQKYEVSFRARWLSGCPLLHTRLYFNRTPHTFRLERPDILGTPGQPNSTLVVNAGPTSENLTHFPVVPAAGESPTISLDLSDPDGVASATLHYRVEGGAFSTVAMTESSGTWSGNIPGQSTGQVVQFYVTATDTLGASNFVPAAGPDSRAMYEVEDNRAATTCINNIRIIMDPSDQAWMFTTRNVMSNGRIACTVIDQESRIYYNAGVRIKGSQRARTQNNRIGFNLGFAKDQLFRNVHRTIAIDRSEGQVVGQRELLFDLMATSSGGVPGEHNDLCYVISPNPTHTSAAILQLARFNSVFLEDQFDNGGDGTVYEYELIYYPTTADAQGYKLPQPDNVLRRNLDDMGDDQENYRWIYLIKNNQDYDDYDPTMRLGKLFGESSANFNAQIANTLDVDQWLRALAYSCATGAGDSFYANSKHNGQFYGRPDGKLLYFPHDLDFSFSATRSIFENSELNRIIGASPAYRRAYLSHLYDICSTVYNQSWMSTWTAHFNECVGGNGFSDDLSYINTRSNYILNQINSQAGMVSFSITTNGGNNFSTNDSPVELQGNGWFDISEIRLASSSQSLPITWNSNTSWSVVIPLSAGANLINLEAYDRLGNLVGTDSITITQTGGNTLPDSSNLVVSEIYYNEPGSVESTEYIELMNIDPSATLDLTGVTFTDGITFTFPAGTMLAPNERIVVVSDEAAFIARFGSGVNIAGAYTGALSNGGESIEISLPDSTVIRAFTYDDSAPWPTEPDGDDYSLVLIAPDCNPDHNLALSWQTSLQTGGTPGTDDSVDYADWKLSFGNPADDADPDGDGWTVIEEFHFGGSPVAHDDLAPMTNFDFLASLFTATVRRRAGVDTKLTLQQSTDMQDWIDSPDAILQSSQRIPGSSPAVDVQTWVVPLTGTKLFFRFKSENQ